jgi:hypothetical protein
MIFETNKQPLPGLGDLMRAVSYEPFTARMTRKYTEAWVRVSFRQPSGLHTVPFLLGENDVLECFQDGKLAGEMRGANMHLSDETENEEVIAW